VLNSSYLRMAPEVLYQLRRWDQVLGHRALVYVAVAQQKIGRVDVVRSAMEDYNVESR
jgi:hypothetical protein